MTLPKDVLEALNVLDKYADGYTLDYCPGEGYQLRLGITDDVVRGDEVTKTLKYGATLTLQLYDTYGY